MVTGSVIFVMTNAFAGPKEDVAVATMKWGETPGRNDPDQIIALYAPDAVLWGTLSPTMRADRAALRDYFVTAFKVLPNLKVAFGEQLIRVYGTIAINTGYYTFSFGRDSETKTLAARYSFTLVNDGQTWMIVAITRLQCQPLLRNKADGGGRPPPHAGSGARAGAVSIEVWTANPVRRPCHRRFEEPPSALGVVEVLA